ncbi:MAG TPA: hypothetical protein VK631_16600 [Solirubrobacteraceae bacterium]|nr:hypothetical protein [Solirubrobacteraceae bacterium]
MNGDLRPLGIGEILDAGIKLFLRHWRTLVISVVGLILPVQILSALVTASVAPEQFDLTSTDSGVQEGEEAEFLIGQGVIALLSVISVLLATAVCFKAVADAYLGVEPEWRRSLRFAVRRLGGLLGVAIVGGILVALATIALIVPGIWLFVSFSVAVPAMLLERIGPIDALRRSFRLVRGRWRSTAGVLVVGYLLIGIIGALVSGVIMIVPSVVAENNTLVGALGAVVGGTVGSVLTTPYSAAVVTLLYFDLRVRKEGLDLQLIAEGAGVERDPDAPLPPPLVADEYTPEERAQAPYWPPPPGWRPAPAPAPAAAWQEPDRTREPPPWRPAPEQSAPSGWLPPRAGGAAEESSGGDASDGSRSSGE